MRNPSNKKQRPKPTPVDVALQGYSAGGVDLDLLLGAAEKAMDDVQPETQIRFAYCLAGIVLTFVVGLESTLRHVRNSAGSSTRLDTSYLRSGYKTQLEWETHLVRVISLGETLYNLQHLGGILIPESPEIQRLDYDWLCFRLLQAEKIEEVCAELSGLRLLVFSGLPFLLLHEHYWRSYRYDAEVFLPDDVRVAVEMKCKIASTRLSTQTVENTLGKSRRQIPEDMCGVIFLKIPLEWCEVSGWQDTIVQGIEKFFRSDSARIAEVIYYTEQFILDERISGDRLALWSVMNPRCRYLHHLEGRSLLNGRLLKEQPDNWLFFRSLTLEKLRMLSEQSR